MSTSRTEKKKLNILLVEDNPGDVRLIREMIGADSSPFELDTVSRLSLAMDRLKINKYDIMLLDLGLPDSQGIETMQKVRSFAANLPIIILTGLADENIGIQAVEQGAQDFLIKWEASEVVLARSINYAIERKRADERLHASEQQLELAVAGADLGLWDWDIRAHRVTFNDRGAEMVASGPGVLQLGTKNIAEIIHPDDQPSVRQKFSAHLRGETPVIDIQCRIHGNSGQWRWVQLSGRVMERDAQGQPLRAAGILKDVSELFLAQEALRQSEESYRDIVETAGEGIFVLDTEDNVIFANQQMADMLGYKVDEILGRSFLDFMDDEGRRGAQSHHQALRAGNREQYDFRFCTRDGREFWGMVSATPLIDRDSGSYRGSLIMLADITERKMAEIRDKARFVLVNKLRTAKGIDDCLLLGCKALFESRLFRRSAFLFFDDEGAITNFAQVGLDKNEAGAIRHGAPIEMGNFANLTQSKHRISKSFFVGQGTHPASEQAFPNISFSAGEMPSWKPGDILIMPIFLRSGEKFDGIITVAHSFDSHRPPSHDNILRFEEIVEMVILRIGEIQQAEALSRERQALAEKNVALKEIMSVVEAEKMEIRKQIASTIDQVLKPAISRLARRDGTINKTYYDLLKYNLDELALTTGGALSISSKLSPREMEICSMIKNGSSSKDIAEALDIALVTVQKHREVIRRKLGLTNKSVNLTTHLRNM